MCAESFRLELIGKLLYYIGYPRNRVYGHHVMFTSSQPYNNQYLIDLIFIKKLMNNWYKYLCFNLQSILYMTTQYIHTLL